MTTGPPFKRAALARFVKLMSHRQLDRGMQLIEHRSRCVRRAEIHEIVTTDDRSLLPGERAQRIGFLGFAEFDVGGVLERGDRVLLDGRSLGVLVGFDECHFPNHYNVVVGCGELMSAVEAGARLGSELRFESAD